MAKFGVDPVVAYSVIEEWVDIMNLAAFARQNELEP